MRLVQCLHQCYLLLKGEPVCTCGNGNWLRLYYISCGNRFFLFLFRWSSDWKFCLFSSWCSLFQAILCFFSKWLSKLYLCALVLLQTWWAWLKLPHVIFLLSIIWVHQLLLLIWQIVQLLRRVRIIFKELAVRGRDRSVKESLESISLVAMIVIILIYTTFNIVCKAASIIPRHLLLLLLLMKSRVADSLVVVLRWVFIGWLWNILAGRS